MNTVVYYPYVHPPAEWLRVAALCWDKVYELTGPRIPEDPVLADGARESELKAQVFESQTNETLFAMHPEKFESGPGQDAFMFLMDRGLAALGMVDDAGTFTDVRGSSRRRPSPPVSRWQPSKY